MNIKLLYLILITLLISNLCMVFMLVKKPHMPNRNNTRNEFLLKELDFTENQKTNFDEVSHKHHMNLRGIDNDIRYSKDLLFTSYGKETAFFIDSIANKIGDLETLKHKEIVSFFGLVKNICNENQAKKFKHLIERGLNRRRPRH